ncbi:hypothetical protein [Nitrospira sp. Nam80]
MRRRVIRFDLLQVPILMIDDLILLKPWLIVSKIKLILKRYTLAKTNSMWIRRYVEGWKTRLDLNRERVPLTFANTSESLFAQ